MRLPKLGNTFDGARRLYAFADLIDAYDLQDCLLARFRLFNRKHCPLSMIDIEMIGKTLYGSRLWHHAMEHLCERIVSGSLGKAEKMELDILCGKHRSIYKDLTGALLARPKTQLRARRTAVSTHTARQIPRNTGRERRSASRRQRKKRLRHVQSGPPPSDWSSLESAGNPDLPSLGRYPVMNPGSEILDSPGYLGYHRVTQA